MFPSSLLALNAGLSSLFDPRPPAGGRKPPADAVPAPPREDAIADVARAVLREAEVQSDPVERERLALAADVLRMLADEDWCLGGPQRRCALALLEALRGSGPAGAGDRPADGLMDAALAVDRGLSCLQDELADWRDFHAFRQALARRLGIPVEHCHPSRQAWLVDRVQAGARLRRARARQRAGGPSGAA
jgi:hypothetical protein